MINCKMCKNLSKMIIESDEKGNIVKYKPNTCRITKQEISNIKDNCFVDRKC